MGNGTEERGARGGERERDGKRREERREERGTRAHAVR